jgi:hypothetical protein
MIHTVWTRGTPGQPSDSTFRCADALAPGTLENSAQDGDVSAAADARTGFAAHESPSFGRQRCRWTGTRLAFLPSVNRTGASHRPCRTSRIHCIVKEGCRGTVAPLSDRIPRLRAWSGLRRDRVGAAGPIQAWRATSWLLGDSVTGDRLRRLAVSLHVAAGVGMLACALALAFAPALPG